VSTDILFQKIAQRGDNAGCILATVVEGERQGERRLWINGALQWSSGTGHLLEANEREFLATERSQLLELEQTKVFAEKIGACKKLVICGAGHVSIPIIQLGKKIGFDVTVIEDRPLFANNARAAGADTVLCDSFLHAMERIPGSGDTYFVIVTRGHRYDTECLRMAIAKPNAYIGMMGSRKRVALVKKQLLEEGIAQELLDRVHTPIGLSIGAETPEEIAISILAEIIQEKNTQRCTSSYDQELLAYLTGEKETDGAILCTIVSKKGSAPREAGTKMLLLRDGTIIGTIGGGCAESRVIQKGLAMLRENISTDLIQVDMTGREAEEEAMVCGGTILVYMERLI
jgi:xanthine dehydrogenase accessory factor